MIRRRCIVTGCSQFVVNGSRCRAHRAQQRAKYKGDWPARSRAAIAIYRATHGDVCPGWRRDPHPIDPADWTTDHEAGPMCRACNSRKKAMGHG